MSGDHHRHIFEESPCEARDAICNLCNDKVSCQFDAYYCRECSSNFHKDCLAITNAKTHEHTLIFIRREIAVLCDICGLYNGLNLYGCLQCDFFVHRQCIYLPKVIKITRHSHRLFHTRRLSDDGDKICGVCRERVVVEFGGYSCTDKTCNYVIHSYCLFRFSVWDGKDLQGEPEPEEIDSEADIAALVEIDGKSKRHFSHHHELLRLDEESEQVCQACILPIGFDSFLGCKQCDFALHDVCASLPRKIEHAVHVHPLNIQVDTKIFENGFFTCSVCNQHSCGFMYKCCQEDCAFKIDVKCASFVEPFNHSVHPHPLYLATTYFNKFYKCVGCNQYLEFAADCNICYFPLEFKCVNLPKLVKYKCDTHPLILYCDKDYRLRIVEPPEWWCEICENNIDKHLIVYTCHDCSTTLHVDCILGKPLFQIWPKDQSEWLRGRDCFKQRCFSADLSYMSLCLPRQTTFQSKI